MPSNLKISSQFLRDMGLVSPAVIVDQQRARANIRSMAVKARAGQANFRPHFKTHQSGAIGKWFGDEGVDRITVSSLAMAEYFAEFGWTDITLAFLLNPLELPRLAELARYLDRKNGRLGLTVDSVVAARALAGTDLPADAWIKIDAGYGRTGTSWDNTEGLLEIQQALGETIPLAGLLTHSGHSYQARNQRNLQIIWETTLGRMRFARDILHTGQSLSLSLGDTPGCSTVESLAGADEVRPGNFVFFDLMQLEIGSCGEQQMAAAVACPVVGIYPDRGQMVVHGGAVHLAKEFLTGKNGQAVYGMLGDLNISPGNAPSLGAVHREAPMVNLSQEHGTISVNADHFEELLGDLEIGDMVLVWPVHSCLAFNLHTQYHTLEGDVLPRR